MTTEQLQQYTFQIRPTRPVDRNKHVARGDICIYKMSFKPFPDKAEEIKKKTFEQFICEYIHCELHFYKLLPIIVLTFLLHMMYTVKLYSTYMYINFYSFFLLGGAFPVAHM